jgi:hypothetical protein
MARGVGLLERRYDLYGWPVVDLDVGEDKFGALYSSSDQEAMDGDLGALFEVRGRGCSWEVACLALVATANRH